MGAAPITDFRERIFMKKAIQTAVLLVLCVAMTGCYGGAGKLSNEYVTIKKYVGVEVEEPAVEETTEEDIDQVLDYMMDQYIRNNDLPEDTQVTDEIVKNGLSTTTDNVEDFREEIRRQIDETKAESALETLETRVWEKVIGNTTVEKWPKDRVQEVKENWIDQYEGYAAEYSMEYDEYMETIGLTEEDLEEAAKSSVKQELIAELIAEKHALKPTEEELQTALEEYADEYMFTNVDLLLEAVPEEEMELLVLQDRVKAWLAERCETVEPSEKEQEEEAQEAEDEAEEKVEEEAVQQED